MRALQSVSAAALALALALGWTVAPKVARAQALTRAAATAGINACLPTNGTGAITAAALRTCLIADIINSAMFPTSDTGSGLSATGTALALSQPILFANFGASHVATDASGTAHASPIYDVVAFGADPTGTNFSTTAFQSAITAALSGGQVYIPCGLYKLASLSGTIVARKSLSLQGQGQDCAELYFPTGNGITLTFGSQFSSTHIHDLSITTGSANIGNGLTLQQTVSNPGPANSANSDIVGVTFRGHDGYVVGDYWSTANVISNVSNVNWDSDLFVGAVGGIGVSLIGQPGASACSGPCYAVGFNFAKTTFNYSAVGILYESYVQGVTMNQMNFTANSIGIQSPTGQTGDLDQLAISNSQFSNNDFNLSQNTPIQSVLIQNSLFLSGSSRTISIVLQGNDNTVIGNQMTSGAVGTNNAVIVGATSGFTAISGNIISTWATGVNIQSGAQIAQVGPNFYSGNTVNVSNLGTGTYNYTYPPASITIAGIDLAQNYSALQTFAAGATATALTSVNANLAPAFKVTSTAAEAGLVMIQENANTAGETALIIAAGLNASSGDTTTTMIDFVSGNNSAVLGTITRATGGTTLAFNTTSDERLKVAVDKEPPGLDLIRKIHVRDFYRRDDPEKHVGTGYFAQELYNVYPDIVTPGGDDPLKNPWLVQYGPAPPLLVKGLQEEDSRVSALTARVGMLEKLIATKGTPVQ